ncbi:MAG: hypothetical protein ACI4EE_12225 [Lachnospiraceae bacterium]
MLEAVLASSLIATIITVLFQYTTNKKSDNLKYITNERSQWRKELRSIAEEIQNANQQDIKSVLVKMQMRINAYGISNRYDIERDGHFWFAMRFMGEEESVEEFEIRKELLITFISLLLKQDWEKAKEEVKGNILDAFLAVTYIGLVGYLIYFNFFVCNLGFDTEILEMIVLICVDAFSLHSIIYRKLCQKDYKKLLDDSKRFRDFGLNEKEIEKTLLKSIVRHLGLGIVLTIIACVRYFCRINIASYEVHIIIIVIISFIAVSLELTRAIGMYNRFRDYIHSVVLAWDIFFSRCSMLEKKKTGSENAD